MFVDLGELERWVGVFLLPFFRIGAMFMAMPIIGTQLVAVRVRLGLSIAVTLLLVPNLPEMPVYNALSLGTWLVVAREILIGLFIGFTLHLLLEVFSVGGQLISNQMGLGFASMTDPANGTSVVVLSQFYLVLVMLLFLLMNGHLLMIEILAESFHALPVGVGMIASEAIWQLVVSGGWLFAAGMLIALPAVTALLVVNFSFGIMTKAAPQLNIFAIGFPFTMLLGIFIVWLSLGGFIGQYDEFARYVLDMIGSYLRI